VRVELKHRGCVRVPWVGLGSSGCCIVSGDFICLNSILTTVLTLHSNTHFNKEEERNNVEATTFSRH